MLAVLAYIGKLMLFGNVYYGGLVVAAGIVVVVAGADWLIERATEGSPR